MTAGLLESISKISTPIGLGGVALLVVLLILRRIITPSFLPQVHRSHAYMIIKQIIDRLYWIALVTIILGAVGYLTPSIITAAAGSASLSDVVIEPNGTDSAILDFRVVNSTKSDLVISRIRLVPIEQISDSSACTAGPQEYTKIYDFHNIEGLDPILTEPFEIPISQVVAAGKADRFGIKVGSHSTCKKYYWKFQTFLVTSAGMIGGQERELRI